MALHGFVHDSALLHYGKKAFRAPRGGGRRPTKSIDLRITVTKVVIYKPILNFELNDPKGLVGQYMHRLGRDIVTDAKSQVGYKTGRLRKSINMQHTRDTKGQQLRIGSPLSYALAHHEGTRPHIILPKPPARIITFRAGAALIRTDMVRHPGTNPNRYLSDQLAKHIR